MEKFARTFKELTLRYYTRLERTNISIASDDPIFAELRSEDIMRLDKIIRKTDVPSVSLNTIHRTILEINKQLEIYNRINKTNKEVPARVLIKDLEKVSSKNGRLSSPSRIKAEIEKLLGSAIRVEREKYLQALKPDGKKK